MGRSRPGHAACASADPAAADETKGAIRSMPAETRARNRQRDGAECETDLNLRIVAWIRQPCADAFRERARIQRDAVLRKFLPLRSAVGGHVQRGMKRVRGSMRWRGSSAR